MTKALSLWSTMDDLDSRVNGDARGVKLPISEAMAAEDRLENREGILENLETILRGARPSSPEATGFIANGLSQRERWDGLRVASGGCGFSVGNREVVLSSADGAPGAIVAASSSESSIRSVCF